MTGVTIVAPVNRKIWLSLEDEASQRVRRNGTTSGKITKAVPAIPRANWSSARAKGRISECPPMTFNRTADAAKKRTAIIMRGAECAAQAAFTPGWTEAAA